MSKDIVDLRDEDNRAALAVDALIGGLMPLHSTVEAAVKGEAEGRRVETVYQDLLRLEQLIDEAQL